MPEVSIESTQNYSYLHLFFALHNSIYRSHHFFHGAINHSFINDILRILGIRDAKLSQNNDGVINLKVFSLKLGKVAVELLSSDILHVFILDRDESISLPSGKFPSAGRSRSDLKVNSPAGIKEH